VAGPLRSPGYDLARWSDWPDEIADGDLVTLFTLTSHDLRWLTSC
jgi:hypothetical protein